MGGNELLESDAHRFGPAAPGEEFVFGSCAPGWHSAGRHEEALDQWISYVQSHDIERVCCLLTGQQLDSDDANLGRYRTAFGPENICHAPIPDCRLAERELLAETVLPFLEDAVDARSPVVVHGLSGIGRTGQVLSAWLVSHHDYDPEIAVETVQQGGRDPMEIVDRGNATEEELFSLLDSF